jgi:hypothetical protein
MRRAALLPPIVLAVALMAPGGCGTTTKTDTSKFTGTQKQVAQTVADLATQARKVDGAKICDGFLTPALKNRLAALAKTTRRGVSCADQLKDSLRDVDVFDLTVESVKIAGTAATVTVKANTNAKRDPTGTLHMVDQRGWRISQLP